MTATTSALPLSDWKKTPVPLIIAGLAFLVAFGEPMATLARDWWSDPEAGHGLLLFPVAVWLAWKRGLVEPRPQPALGMTLLVGAVLLRFLSGLAAELFTMRGSLIGAILALIVYTLGWRQLVRWWLPLVLLILSVPLPSVVLGSLALPLQFKASQWGAALLDMRHVPVRLNGNVIMLPPGQSLFVTEACSGLRSLTALLALGVLIAGLWLRSPWSRLILVFAAIPVAMVLNAVRIFITGFVAYFINPDLVQGIMHYSEGWVIFVVAFMILAGLAWLLRLIELRKPRPA